MRTTSSRALITALLATTCLLSTSSKFADGASIRTRAHSTQVVYTENDEQRDHASFDNERAHLRTVTAGESQRRHLSFWSSLLSKYTYTYRTHRIVVAHRWLLGHVLHPSDVLNTKSVQRVLLRNETSHSHTHIFFLTLSYYTYRPCNLPHASSRLSSARSKNM